MAEETVVDHGSRSHALLSASGSSRWLNCTPSPRLESEFENTTSSYAEEGTLAHEFAELNLKLQLNLISKREYNKLIKPFKANEYYSSDMEEHVQKHVDYVIQQYTEAKRITEDAVLMIEQKVDYSEYVEEGYGTCDDTIVADGVLEVIDFKYGKGVKVYSEENTQGKLYGLGAYLENSLLFDIHTIRITIVQPRLDHISSWEISVEDLIKWAEDEVRPKAKMAFAGEGETKAGSWCRFCKVQSRCRTLAEQNLQVAKKEFQDPNLLTDEELIENYKLFPQIQAWTKSVSDYLLKEALAGKDWPEHKLVVGRSNRVWVDPDKVESKLKAKRFKKPDYMTTPKLLGITAIEKLVGKGKFYEVLGDLVDKPQGKPTLVHESDKRDPYQVTDARSDFAD